MFRRRKSGSDDTGELDEQQTPDSGDELVAEDRPEPRADGGPWDATEAFPERDRVDLGSLWVPVGADFEIQLVMHEQNGAWVTARHGESELQLQAFAASRSGSLWDDVSILSHLASSSMKSARRRTPSGVVSDMDCSSAGP